MKVAARERAPATPAGHLGEAGLAGVLGYQLAQARIVVDEIFGRLVGKPLQLRRVEFTILVLIDENPGGSPAQLSKALAVTRSNISIWIDQMERRGLITREANVTDRRGQHLRTTAKGAALAAEATRQLVEGERLAFPTLTRGEQMILGELLHKLARARP